MNPIEFNYKKLKIAQDLPKKTLESIGMKLMKKNSNGIFEIPKDEVIVSYINDLASKRKIKHYILTGEYENIYLFDSDEIINDLNIIEIQAQKITEIVQIQCYDEKINASDNIPIEISKIDGLFKLPKSLFNSGTCIYFLCRNEKVVYVGQAENVHQRLVEHMRTKDFDAVFYIRVQANKMNKIENSLISYLKPEYNKTGFNATDNKSKSLAESVLNSGGIVFNKA